MVRLLTSLLAVTLATGSALASSNEYHRELNQVQSRGFLQGEAVPYRRFRFGRACAGFGQNNLQSRGFDDKEDLFVRDLDAYDGLEAREPSRVGKAIKFGKMVGTHKRTKQFATGVNRVATGVAIGQEIASTFQSRGFEDDEDRFVRDLDAYDGLEAREPSRVGKAVKFGKMVATHKRTKQFATGVNRVATGVAVGQDIASTFQSRGFEDEEDRFVRDLDAYDGLEAREPGRVGEAIKFGKMVATHKRTKQFATGANRVATGVAVGQEIASTFQSRGLEENEDLFGRDLDAEELYGREYDFLDERDTIDDLD